MKTTKESILDIVYGVHAVTESLEANTGNKLYIQDDLRGKMWMLLRPWQLKRRFPSLGHQRKPCLI